MKGKKKKKFIERDRCADRLSRPMLAAEEPVKFSPFARSLARSLTNNDDNNNNDHNSNGPSFYC